MYMDCNRNISCLLVSETPFDNVRKAMYYLKSKNQLGRQML